MATVTLKPNGDSTPLAWTPSAGTAHWELVDEGIASQDGDTTRVTCSPTSSNTDDKYTLDDTPGDFDVATAKTRRAHAKQAGLVDDSITVVIDAGAGGSLIISGFSSTTYITLEDASPVSNTQDKATWDANTYLLRALKSASGMADSVTMSVTAVEVVVDYTASGPATEQPYYHRTGGVPGMRIGRPGSVFGRSW